MNFEDLQDLEEIKSKDCESNKLILSSHDTCVCTPKAEDSKLKSFSYLGLFILIMAVFGGGSMAPCFNLYGNISTFTKNLWRCQMNFLISIPLVLYTLYNEPSSIDFNFLKSIKGNALLLLSGAIFTGGCGTFVASAWLTMASHTYTLGSLAGVIIIIIRIILMYPVHNLEKIGTATVIFGSFTLMYFGTSEGSNNKEGSLTGDVIALLSSCFYALYFPLNKSVISKIPGSVILLYTSISAFFCFLIINVTYTELLFSIHPEFGIFGWLSNKQILISLLLVAPICGLCGNGAPIFALKYFEPHIVGNICLFEPFIGQIISCALGIDEIPGFITFFGVCIILFGIYLVANGTRLNSPNKGDDVHKNIHEDCLIELDSKITF